MAFDYKKEYKEFYMPKGTPSIVTVPKMNYIAVRGSGNPNDADGEYKQAIGLLYGIAFTIKMSKKEDHQIDGYFDYVVPPLEGFWWQGERRPGDAMLRTDRAGRRDQVLLPLPKRNSHRFGDCFFFVRQNLSSARACRASSPSAAGGRCSEARMEQRSKGVAKQLQVLP